MRHLFEGRRHWVVAGAAVVSIGGLFGLRTGGDGAVLMLLVLVGGSIGILWWRGARRKVMRRAGCLRSVERLRLSPHESLHLVEVDGARLLVGSGAGGLRMLARLTPPRIAPATGERP